MNHQLQVSNNQGCNMKTITFAVTLIICIMLQLSVPANLQAQNKPVRQILSLPVDFQPEAFDDIETKQLAYFIQIAESLDRYFEEERFFEPYDKETLVLVSDLLQRVAEIEPDACTEKYFYSLSQNVLDGKFYTFDPHWMTLKNNRADILFLPDQRFNDSRWALKHYYSMPFLRFNTVVYAINSEETFRYKEYTRRFKKLQDNLPGLKKMTVPFTSFAPSIKVATLIKSSRPNPMTAIYPGRELFYAKDAPGANGFSVIFFKNLMDSYTECVLKPIAEVLLAEPDIQKVKSDAFLSNQVMHRISHHMGPVFRVTVKGKKNKSIFDDEEDELEKKLEQEMRAKGIKQKRILQLIAHALDKNFPVIEEIKARVLAIHNISALVKIGLIEPGDEVYYYSTYLMALMDRMRKETDKEMAKAHIVQFNYLLKNGAIAFNLNNRKLSVQMGQFAPVMETLAQTVLTKFTSPGTIFSNYAKKGPELEELLNRLKFLPKKIETRKQ
jgi:hypothetical protein